MSLEGSGEHTRNWAALIEQDKLTAEDLYDLAEETFSIYREEEGEVPLEGHVTTVTLGLNGARNEEVSGEDDVGIRSGNEASLSWGNKNGRIGLYYQERGDDRPYDAIHVEIDQGKFHTEFFELRKEPLGEIKAFWVRPEKLYSMILDENLEGDYLEVPLNPVRIKRIAQVLLSASARTAVETATQ